MQSNRGSGWRRESVLFLIFIIITAIIIVSMYSSFLKNNPRTTAPTKVTYNFEQFEQLNKDISNPITTKPAITKQPPKKKGFHFVFNSDCSRKTGYNFASFIMFYSFLTMYPDENSGHTMTELYSCDKEKYFVPPWHAPGVLPSHCKLARVNTFSKYNTTMASQGYLPYNKPTGFMQLLSGDWGTKHDDDVVVILDPDFYFLKPLSPVFLNLKKNEMINGFYGVGAWQLRTNKDGKLKDAMDIVCPGCRDLTSAKAETYCAGVPNILRVSDLRKIVPVWTENTYILYAVTHGWQEEQFAYITAAAHLNFDSSARRDLFVSESEEGDGDFTFIHYCQQMKMNNGWRFWKHEFTIKAATENSKAVIFDTQTIDQFLFTCDKKVVITVPTADMNITGKAFASFIYITMTRAINGANLFWHQLFCGGTRVI